MRSRYPTVVAVLLGILAASSLAGGQAATITLVPSATYQTIRGWEVVAYADQAHASYAQWQGAALDATADAGITRVRLEVRAGAEHPVDNFATWVAAGRPDTGPGYAAWRARRYETIDDNGDPNVLNPGGFHWTDLDANVADIVTPLRQRLAARGEKLSVHLTYVAFLSQVTSGRPYVHQNPAEYAEFMLAAFQHLQSTFGWAPDGLEIILEPDNTSPPWSGALIGQVIAATVPRLAAVGFSPDIVAPSTTCMSNAVPWFDALAAVPAARAAIKEIAYHRYCGVSGAALQGLASRGASTGVATSMLEWWSPGNTFLTLHEDLEAGRASAWQQGPIADRAGSSTPAISFITDQHQAVIAPHTRFLRQYYQHVRVGAVRVGATTRDARFAPLAFRDAHGGYTVMVKADTAATVTIAGLPAGSYGVTYTASRSGSPDAPDLEGSLPDRTIAAGQLLSFQMPAWGVAAVFARAGAAAGTPAPPTGLTIESVANGRVALRWTPPSATTALTGFQVEGGFSPGAAAGALPVGLVPGVSLALPDGAYYLRVRSLAGALASAPSNEVLLRVGTATPPSPPSMFEGLVVGADVHLLWHTTFAGGTPDLAVLDVEGPVRASLPLGAAESFAAPNVPPGTYTLRVRSVNAAGTSAPSNAITLTVPSSCSGTPRPIGGLEAYALGGRLFVTWDYGAGGPAASGYVLSSSGAVTGTLATPSRVVSGAVPPGVYTLRVAAQNACGTSAASAPVTVTVP